MIDPERLAVVETRLDTVDGTLTKIESKLDQVVTAVAHLRGGMLALGGLWTVIVGAAVLARMIWQ